MSDYSTLMKTPVAYLREHALRFVAPETIASMNKRDLARAMSNGSLFAAARIKECICPQCFCVIVHWASGLTTEEQETDDEETDDEETIPHRHVRIDAPLCDGLEETEEETEADGDCVLVARTPQEYAAFKASLDRQLDDMRRFRPFAAIIDKIARNAGDFATILEGQQSHEDRVTILTGAVYIARSLYRRLPEPYRSNPEIVRAAIYRDPTLYAFVPPALKTSELLSFAAQATARINNNNNKRR